MTNGSLSRWEGYLKRPTGWIVVGVLILMMSSGAFTYRSGDQVFALSGQLGKFYSFILSMLGIVFITVGAHVASQHWPIRRILIDIILVVFWITSIGTAGYEFLSLEIQPYPFVNVNYDYWKKELDTELSTPYLYNYKKAKFVLAVTNMKYQNEVYDNQNVDFSEPFDSPQSKLSKTTIIINCVKLAPKLKIGDTLRLYLIKIDEKIGIDAKTRIADIDNGSLGVKPSKFD